MRRWRSILLGLVIAGCADAARGSELAVYLPDYRATSIGDLNLYGTTNLILFSAEPREDGSVNVSRITPALLELAKQAGSEGVAVTVSIGGWGRGKTFASAVSSEESRARFVEEAAAFCARHQLDGIDIDWEFPKGEKEHADFALFLEALSKRLRSEGRMLTVALGYTRPLPPACWQWIDRVHLMSYQPWSDQDYEKWLEGSVQRFLDSGLPPEKLLIGLGFFTKEKGGERRATAWKHLAEGVAIPKSSQGYWPVGKETCDLRARLVKQHGLGGIMVWEYGHDSDHPDHSLLRHTSEALGRIPVSPR